MKMKNMFVKSMMAALLLSIGTMTVNAGRAHAYLLAAVITGSTVVIRDHVVDDSPWNRSVVVFGCIVLLPFCLLDEKVDGLPGVSKTDLMNSGYTQKEADQIFSDGPALAKRLQEKQQRIVVGEYDTLESITTDVRSVLPEASDAFVSFYFSNAIPVMNK